VRRCCKSFVRLAAACAIWAGTARQSLTGLKCPHAAYAAFAGAALRLVPRTHSGRATAGKPRHLLGRSFKTGGIAAAAAAVDIDLRSDTVTKPSRGMRDAIANAEVGDDVFGDDPTVLELERRMAQHFGKEAAMFVPSGTQGNLISIMVHTWGRGCEYIVGDRSHSFLWEQGGPSQFGGVHARPIRNLDDGTMRLEEIVGAVRPDNVHFPVTTLLCLEDTHNMCGGRVLSKPYMSGVVALAREHGLKLHMDGARGWNAIAASGDDPRTRWQDFDSMSVCLSKGLGAPVGSVVLGSAEFMTRARRLRKGLGGGMRQAGVLAAAGVYALDNHLGQFTKDQVNAKRLAEGLAKVPGLKVDANAVETNIVMVGVDSSTPLGAAGILKALEARGVRGVALPDGRLRFVTHLGVDEADIDLVLQIVGELLANVGT